MKNSYSKVHLDFETRSAQLIEKTGAWRYAEHPSTSILCLAFAKDNGPVELINRDEFEELMNPKLERLNDYARDPNNLFCAHNAFFEYSIWHCIMVPKFGMPKIPIQRWRCSAAKAAARGLPRALGNVAVELGCHSQKMEGGRAVMLKLSKPNSKGVYINKPELFDQLYAYCIADVEAEREVDSILPDLCASEQTVWFLDMYINSRGICIDTKAVNSALRIASELEETLTKELIHITDGKVDKASKHAAVRKFLGSQGIVMPSVDRAHVAERLEQGALPEAAQRVLEIKQELGRSSLAKYDALARSVCSDGRVRDILMYHGAGTGRFSGKVVQLQNLPSRGLGKVDGTDIAEALHIENDRRILREPSVSAALSAAIRGMFLPTLGQKLIVADYSAIEARGVMWLADDKVGLKMFSDSDAGLGPEVYVQMARMLYGDDTITKENASSKRDLGKQTILGCGYQMGVDRFLNTCLGYGMDVSQDMAQKAVQFYREQFYGVVRMWTAQERAAMAAMKGQKVRCGKVIWYLKDRWLICVLPSGREMAYFKPEVSMKDGRQKLSYVTVDSQTKQSLRKDMYGGLIVENICQAVARDVMAWAMVRVHRAGYRVLFTVHDEIVAEHPNPDMDEFIKIMTEIPPWAKGFPIKASGWIGERYKKG